MEGKVSVRHWGCVNARVPPGHGKSWIMMMSCNFTTALSNSVKVTQNDTVDTVCTGLLTDQFSTAMVIRDGMHS